MKKNSQTIKCDVYDCKFCDLKKSYCNLKEIKVSNINESQKKEATMCSSYILKKD